MHNAGALGLEHLNGLQPLLLLEVTAVRDSQNVHSEKGLLVRQTCLMFAVRTLAARVMCANTADNLNCPNPDLNEYV